MERKVAVVTGGGSGIGKSVALALAKNGYNVVIAGRRQQMLDSTVAEAEADAANIKAKTADVSDPQSVRELFAFVKNELGRIDLLFNNAGIFVPGVAFEDVAYEQWKAVVDVNLSGMFLCAQSAFRLMKEQNPQGGRIINNGSISAHAPRPASAAYTATKHGVTGLTKSISLDGRKYDIACGQIDIGNAMTDLAAGMAKGVRQANGELAAEAMMDVQQVADAVVHMAGLPLQTNIQFLTIMATKMPFIGRG